MRKFRSIGSLGLILAMAMSAAACNGATDVTEEDITYETAPVVTETETETEATKRNGG